MKIGLVSDSHKKVKLNEEAIDHLISNGVEAFIHAGDIILEENLSYLADKDLPYWSVFGNNDHHLIELEKKYNLFHEPYKFKFFEHTFKLMHLPFHMTPDTNIIVFGHTHMFEVQKTSKALYINPGEICARNKQQSECAMLEIKENEYIVEHHFRHPTEKEWTIKRYNFPKDV